MSGEDWLAWHDRYEDPASSMSRRLTIVRRMLADALEKAPAGAISLIGLCAGQGRDVLGVLPTHPRKDDVHALLVELDQRNTHRARADAQALGLDKVRVLQADARISDHYEDTVPANVLLACGIFGNIAPDDIRSAISVMPMLCADHATVIWTRHRRPPDLTPALREWFADAGFAELAFEPVPDSLASVGLHRLATTPTRWRPGVRLFTLPQQLVLWAAWCQHQCSSADMRAAHSSTDCSRRGPVVRARIQETFGTASPARGGCS